MLTFYAVDDSLLMDNVAGLTWSTVKPKCINITALISRVQARTLYAGTMNRYKVFRATAAHYLVPQLTDEAGIGSAWFRAATRICGIKEIRV